MTEQRHFWNRNRPKGLSLVFASLLGALVLLLLIRIGVSAFGPEPDSVRAPVSAGSTPYEEALGGAMESGVKRVDHAILSAAAKLELCSDDIALREVRTVRENGEMWHVQTLEVCTADRRSLLEALERTLADSETGALLGAAGEDEWRVLLDGRVTHRLFLKGSVSLPVEEKAEDEAAPPEPTPTGPRLVIVIDDLGESVTSAKRLAALSYPVTFAIWPRSSHTAEIAELADETGREIMVHQPMEPVSYPRANPGPGALFTSMNAEEVRRTVAENIALVPGAVGINNHMGSKLTQSAAHTAAVAEELAERGLIALDSVTHAKTRFQSQARRAGVPAFRRDIFLDVMRDERAILHQLDKARKIALRSGFALAIGHPYPQTISALEKWKGAEDGRVRIVTLSQARDVAVEAAASSASGDESVTAAGKGVAETAAVEDTEK